MANKYYISNNIRFIQGRGNLMETPSNATHFKHRDAVNYMVKHPDHVAMLYGKKNRTYVVSTPQKFLGINDDIVNDISKAKSFNSPDDAFKYIDDNCNVASYFDEVFVIDSTYHKIKRKVKSEDTQQAPAKRIFFSPGIRKKVLDKTNICGICGRPILDGEASIDHIVPLSRGGTNDLDNLRPTHEACNHMKYNYTDDEMVNIISDIGCYNIYKNPADDVINKYTRAIVRSTINRFSGVINDG